MLLVDAFGENAIVAAATTSAAVLHPFWLTIKGHQINWNINGDWILNLSEINYCKFEECSYLVPKIYIELF